jgi:hypothetical protein
MAIGVNSLNYEFQGSVHHEGVLMKKKNHIMGQKKNSTSRRARDSLLEIKCIYSSMRSRSDLTCRAETEVYFSGSMVIPRRICPQPMSLENRKIIESTGWKSNSHA